MKMRITTAPALLACGVMLAASAALAGCGAGSAASRPASGTAAAGTPDASTMAIVQCYRAHGDPGFPDPVYDPGDGRWHFAISPGTAPASTQRACQHLFPSVSSSPPVPQAQFQQLVRLAECIRQHGVPSWPDPNPDGAFGLPPSLQQKTPAFAQAAKACQRYMPSGGLNVYATS
jgi:hypothetical protein